METVIAIELIAGVIFVVVCWVQESQAELSRYSRQRLLDPYDDEWNDSPEREADRRLSAMRSRVRG